MKKIILFLTMIVVIFTACKKKCSCDESLDADDPACCETPITPTPTPGDTNRYTVKLNFGPSDLSALRNTDRIKKLVDSANIVEIRFISDSTSWMEKPLSEFMNKTNIKNVFAMSSKIKGSGPIVFMDTKGSESDSLWMVQHGYRFITNTTQQPYDMIVNFGPDNMNPIRNTLHIYEADANPLVKNIVMVPDSVTFGGRSLSSLVKELQNAHETSKKVIGNGPLVGLINDSDKDSLWAVQQGYRIVRDPNLKPPADPADTVRVFTFRLHDYAGLDASWRCLDSAHIKWVILKVEGDWQGSSEFIVTDLLWHHFNHSPKYRGAGTFRKVDWVENHHIAQVKEWGFDVDLTSENELKIKPHGLRVGDLEIQPDPMACFKPQKPNGKFTGTKRMFKNDVPYNNQHRDKFAYIRQGQATFTRNRMHQRSSI